MSVVFERIIRIPPGLTDEKRQRLAEAVSAAVAAQNRVALLTPHVLRFQSPCEDHGDHFRIKHEPAQPLQSSEVFDPTSEVSSFDDILNWSAAIFDALGAAHGFSIIHGGMAVGTIIETPDGIKKVTDFGIAPAICAVAGHETYLELTVSPDPNADHATGVWEVLDPSIGDRDDRICGFIDPLKWISGLHLFESGSDIAAAAILLQLLAEHRHPLLDPGNHRLSATAIEMAWRPYVGLRRSDLWDLTDPTIKSWRNLLELMLTTDTARRPTAVAVLADLAQMGAKPKDDNDLLKIELAKTESNADAGHWQEVSDSLEGLEPALRHGKGGATFASRVERLRTRLDAATLLTQAETQLYAGELESALETINRIPSIEGMDTQAITSLREKIQHKLEVIRTEDRIASALAGQTDEQNPYESLKHLDDLTSTLDRQVKRGIIVSNLLDRQQDLLQRVEKRRLALGTRIEASNEERRAVREWLHALQQTWANEEWSAVRQALTSIPAMTYPDPTLVKQIEQHKSNFAALERVLVWTDQLQEAMDADDIGTVTELSSNHPTLDGLPSGTAQQVNDLLEHAEQLRTEHECRARASAWLESVEKAVTDEDWTLAQAQLDHRPELSFWPNEFAQHENELRDKVELKIAKRKLDQIAQTTPDTSNDLTELLTQADSLAKRLADSLSNSVTVKEIFTATEEAKSKVTGNYLNSQITRGEEYLEEWDLVSTERLLHEAERLPSLNREQNQRIDAFRKLFNRQKLAMEKEEEAKKLGKAIAAKEEKLKKSATRFMADIVQSHFEGLIDPSKISTTVDSIQWRNINPAEVDKITSRTDEGDQATHQAASRISQVVPTAGQAELKITLSLISDAGGAQETRKSFAFAFDLQQPSPILDSDFELRRQVSDLLTHSILHAQQTTLSALIKPLRGGLFPGAEIHSTLPQPTPETLATIHLLSTSEASGKIDVRLRWIPENENWQYLDDGPLVSTMIDLAEKDVAYIVYRKLSEHSPLLQTYRDALKIEVQPPPLSRPTNVPRELRFDCLLSLQLPTGKHQPLCRVLALWHRVGDVKIDTNLSKVQGAVEQIIVSRQNTSLASVLRQLEEMSPIKVTVSIEPRKIKRPTEYLQCTLVIRGGRSASISAVWNPAALEYQLSEDAATQLESALTPVQKPAPPKEPSTQSRGLAVLATITAAALLVAMGIILTRPNKTPNETPHAPPIGPPVVTNRPNPCEKMQERVEKFEEQGGELTHRFNDKANTKPQQLQQDIADYLKRTQAFLENLKSNQCNEPMASVEQLRQNAEKQQNQLTDYDLTLTGTLNRLKQIPNPPTIASLTGILKAAQQELQSLQWKTPETTNTINSIQALAEQIEDDQREALENIKRLAYRRGTENAELAGDALYRIASIAYLLRHYGYLEKDLKTVQHESMAELLANVNAWNTLYDEPWIDQPIKPLLADEHKTLQQWKDSLEQYDQEWENAANALNPEDAFEDIQQIQQALVNAQTHVASADQAWSTPTSSAARSFLSDLSQQLEPIPDSLEDSNDSLETLQHIRRALGIIDNRPSPLANWPTKNLQRFLETKQENCLEERLNLIQNVFKQLKADFASNDHDKLTLLQDGIKATLQHAAALQKLFDPQQTIARHHRFDPQTQIPLTEMTSIEQNLNTYEKHYQQAMNAGSLEHFKDNLTQASKAWPTHQVSDGLRLLGNIEPSLRKATNLSNERDWIDWYGVEHFINKADQSLQQDGFGLFRDTMTRLVNDQVKALANRRRQLITNPLQEARDWLAGRSSPTGNLSDINRAVTARIYLNKLGVFFDFNFRVIDELGAFDADTGKIIQYLLSSTTVTIQLANGVDMIFVAIPGPAGEYNESFWLSQTEVTVGQYQALLPGRFREIDDDINMGRTNKNFQTMKSDPNNPMAFMSLDDARAFTRELNNQLSQGNRVDFRIPHTSEWMAAFRCNQHPESGQWYRGYPGIIKYNADNLQFDMTWFNPSTRPDSLQTGTFPTYAAGRLFKPNQFNLVQMIGNVEEWTQHDDQAITLGHSFSEIMNNNAILLMENQTPNDGDRLFNALAKQSRRTDQRILTRGFRVVAKP